MIVHVSVRAGGGARERPLGHGPGAGGGVSYGRGTPVSSQFSCLESDFQVVEKVLKDMNVSFQV